MSFRNCTNSSNLSKKVWFNIIGINLIARHYLVLLGNLDAEVVLSSEKPRAKLRDSFTHQSEEVNMTEDVTSINASAIEFKEPIISERSQTLKDIIRIHEQG